MTIITTSYKNDNMVSDSMHSHLCSLYMHVVSRNGSEQSSLIFIPVSSPRALENNHASIIIDDIVNP